MRSLPLLLKAGCSAGGLGERSNETGSRATVRGTNELIASEAVQQIVSESRASVTVLPETVISRWTVATEAFWEPTLEKLQ